MGIKEARARDLESFLIGAAAILAVVVPGASGIAASGPMAHAAFIVPDSSRVVVTTDKTDYAPGETVTVTGSGWLPNEAVLIVIHEEPQRHPDTAFVCPADGSGTFVTRSFRIPESGLGLTFYLTATSQVSSVARQTVFTDGLPIASWSVSPSCAGGGNCGGSPTRIRRCQAETATLIVKGAGFTDPAAVYLRIGESGGFTGLSATWISSTEIRATLDSSWICGGSCAYDIQFYVCNCGTYCGISNVKSISVIQQHATSTSLSQDSATTSVNQSVRFTATVANTSGGPNPTSGSVVFQLLTGPECDQVTQLGIVALAGSNTAVFLYTFTTEGTRRVKAYYAGSCYYESSSYCFITHTVGPSCTTPAVTSDPADQVVCHGASASFSASATGNQELRIQWQVSRDGGLTFSDVLGATESLYRLVPSVSDDGNQYRAKFSDSCGTVYSGTATLTVTPEPAVSVNSPTVWPGQSATVSATTTASRPRYLWTVPGGAVNPGDVPSFQTNVAGQYCVEVTDETTGCQNNACGTVTAGSLPAVDVNSPSACEGQLVTVSATTDASRPRYVWTVPGGAAKPGDVSSFQTNVAGQYCVEVTDETTGCQNSACGTVTLHAPPAVDVDSTANLPGQGATVSAVTTASRPRHVWTVPGGAVNPGDVHSFQTNVAGQYCVEVTDEDTGCRNSACGTVPPIGAGTITVEEETEPDSPASSPQFGFVGSGFPDGCNLALFDLSDNGSRTCADLPPGTYEVAQVTWPTGWNLMHILVTGDSDGDSAVDTVSRRVRIKLDPGESITITFGHTPVGTITVTKTTTPDGVDAMFGFTGTGFPTGCGLARFSLAGGGSQSCSELQPGVYEIAEETLPSGWSLTSIDVNGDADADSSIDPAARKVRVDLDAGETITLAFANSLREPPGDGGSGSGSGSGLNSAPTANAGPDQSVCLGERVCVDGSQSFDPDDAVVAGRVGEAVDLPPYVHQDHAKLKFHWSFGVSYVANGKPVLRIPEGSRAAETLEGTDTEFACFTPDLVDDYELVLTVTDESGRSAVDALTVHVERCSKVFGCWYPAGWNLISLRAQPIDPSAEVVLADADVGGIALAYSDGYEPATTLSPLAGYWVHFLRPGSIFVLGREIRDTVSLRLKAPGWHLISAPFSIDWSRVLVLVDGVERYVNEDVARGVIDEFCACYDPEIQIYRVSNSILPCQGYWVRTLRPDVMLTFEWSPSAQIQELGEGGCSDGSPTQAAPPPPKESRQSHIAVQICPNPVRAGTVRFELTGPVRVEGIRVQVFTASGHSIWSAEGPRNILEWEPRAEDGERLPWGPYICCIDGFLDGIWAKAGCQVLFLAQRD